MRVFYLATLIGLLLVAVACGGDSGSDSREGSTATPSATGPSATATSAPPASSAEDPLPPTSSSTVQPPAPADDSAAVAVAQRALLQLGDLPAGWTSKPYEDTNGTDIAYTGECERYNDNIPGTLADVTSDRFTGPEQQRVVSYAALLDNEASAVAAGPWIELPMECLYQLEQGLTQIYKESLPEKGIDPSADVIVTADPMPWMNTPDGSAYRVIWTIVDGDRFLAGTMDFITARAGRVITEFVFTSYIIPDDQAFGQAVEVEAEESRLIQILAERAAQANAALP